VAVQKNRRKQRGATAQRLICQWSTLQADDAISIRSDPGFKGKANDKEWFVRRHAADKGMDEQKALKMVCNGKITIVDRHCSIIENVRGG
jgi:hypothetical protein